MIAGGRVLPSGPTDRPGPARGAGAACPAAKTMARALTVPNRVVRMESRMASFSSTAASNGGWICRPYPRGPRGDAGAHRAPRPTAGAPCHGVVDSVRADLFRAVDKFRGWGHVSTLLIRRHRSCILSIHC
jgi:hypothetical protein